MQCVILAGGLGTRMLPHTQAVPKALLPVAGRPFAHWQLASLKKSGVTEVVYCIGHLGSLVRDFVGDGRRFGLEVRYVDEGESLRGTGGALRLACEQGVLAERFLVTYGDSYLPIDFSGPFASFVSCGRPALMTVLKNDGRWDKSNVIWKDGGIVLYDKEPRAEMLHIDYGLLAFTRSLVAERIALKTRTRVELSELLSALSREGLLAGYEVNERFYEVGSPAGLEDLEARLFSF